jgi:YfiH family protein
MPHVTVATLNALDGVRHGFFTRKGGVSGGIYASNNCGLGSGDDPDAVATNRARSVARLDLAPDRLVTLHQVHSATAIRVEAPWKREANPRADAMATAVPGIALGVLGADCVPVLLADAEARVVGAAHAGWKGALAGVVEAAVAAMVALGARVESIAAGVGPGIAQRSYEVGPEFPAPFLARDEADAAFFAPAATPGKWLFDLKGYVAARLDAAGVRHPGMLPYDTCAEEALFFSHRRATKRGERDYGRLLSAIALEA